MGITLDLPEELAAELSAKAAQADLVAYWRAEGLIGARPASRGHAPRVQYNIEGKCLEVKSWRQSFKTRQQYRALFEKL